MDDFLSRLLAALPDHVIAELRPSYPGFKDVALQSEKDNSKLVVEVCRDATWLADPFQPVGSDKLGAWPRDTVFPSADKHFSPKGSFNPPEQLPYKLKSDLDRDFLEAPSLVQGHKLMLNSAFSHDFVSAPTSSQHHVLDCHVRRALLDNAIARSLSEVGETYVKSILADAEEGQVELPEELKDPLQLILDCFMFVGSSTWRVGQACSALLVSNRLALRKLVLEKCRGSEETKGYMLRSTFFSPHLFGPVPEEIADRVARSSANYKDHLITVPASSGSGSGTAKPGPSRSAYGWTKSQGFKRATINYSKGSDNKRSRPDGVFRQRVPKAQQQQQPSRQQHQRSKSSRGKGQHRK